jgi:anti-anti-sigma factor
MDVKITDESGVILLEPAGAIDTRSSIEFERKVLEALESPSRRFAVDFGHVDLITSAGIRVLVMLAQRLRALDGRLVLCGFNEQIQTVFEIAGLAQHFQIAATRQDAMARLDEPTPAAKASRISRFAARLLQGESPSPAGARDGREQAEGASELSAHVARLLDQTPAGPDLAPAADAAAPDAPGPPAAVRSTP